MEVAQVGVGTRSRARGLAMEATNTPRVKRRKLNDRELRISSPYIQLRNRKIIIQSSVSPPDTSLEHRPVMEDHCHGPSLDHDRGGVSVSCCSSNGSNHDKVDEGNEFVDLDDDNVEVETSTHYNCRERRETTPSSELREESDGMDSATKKPSESRQRSTAEKMPTQAELDEFFFAAEKEHQKQFTDKYNYDFVKDEPLEGRYEWVRIKP